MAACAALVAFVSGCMPDLVVARVDYTTFCDAKAALEAREAALVHPRKQNVSLELSAPYIPTPVQARGAAAMGPPGDLRMILLGPGGATAMDLWLHDDRYRFSVPAIGRTLRGDRATPPEKRRGLPVDFLRWWMLDPLRGELLFASQDAGGTEFVLRDRDAYVVAKVAPDGQVTATRTTWSGAGDKLDEETIHATGFGCATVDYHQASTDLTVHAKCESESKGVPEKAFVDPDAGAP